VSLPVNEDCNDSLIELVQLEALRGLAYLEAADSYSKAMTDEQFDKAESLREMFGSKCGLGHFPGWIRDKAKKEYSLYRIIQGLGGTSPCRGHHHGGKLRVSASNISAIMPSLALALEDVKAQANQGSSISEAESNSTSAI
jgi:hypothetical protein